MTDRFENSSPSLAGPASHAFAITPSDAGFVAETTRGIYVGTGGNIAVTMLSGADAAFSAVPGGTVLPLRLTKVLATGTTASGLVGLA